MSMSTAQLNTPEPFNFAKPENWIKWRLNFEHYGQVSNLIERSGEMQVSTIIYSMSVQAENVLVAFGLTEDELKDYNIVLAKFDHYLFKKMKCHIRESVVQSTNIQAKREPVDNFITSPYGLVEHCEYGAQRDEMIRDRLVVGIRDKTRRTFATGPRTYLRKIC